MHKQPVIWCKHKANYKQNQQQWLRTEIDLQLSAQGSHQETESASLHTSINLSITTLPVKLIHRRQHAAAQTEHRELVCQSVQSESLMVATKGCRFAQWPYIINHDISTEQKQLYFHAL